MPIAIERHSKTAREIKTLIIDCRGSMREGETISTVGSVTVSPSGLTVASAAKNSAAIQEPGRRTIAVNEGITALASSGTAGVTYTVTIPYTTSQGQDIDAVVKLTVT